MSDRFHPLSASDLAGWIARELDAQDSVLGIPRTLFFEPQPGDPFQQEIYGQRLETPFGVAAGPHSQLAQNIVVAWLCGARFIELKTVQTLDQLEVPKPCIDMQDEGYNVEWSQELRLEQSLDEYLLAWVLVHSLHRKLGFAGPGPGVIFNLSVGYDLAGIKRRNMQLFLEAVAAPGDRLGAIIEQVAEHLPEAAQVSFPSQLSDNVTLSTMHGCPPDEIGAIASYLMVDRGLHTSVKLNPTLLGPDRVRAILHDALGFTDVTVPDEAFDHDLRYPDALALLAELRATAERRGLTFGVKLSNTLEVNNACPSFDVGQDHAYLSGRPLQAITVNLAHQLARDHGGALMMSYAGGADAFNAPALLRCGMRTVTSCSDLLKSGGYLRLRQYLETTREAMAALDASSLPELVIASAALPSWSIETVGGRAEVLQLASRAGTSGGTASEVSETGADMDTAWRAAAQNNLARYAAFVLDDPALRCASFDRNSSKTHRALGLFDCIAAPCTDACATRQDVPGYMAAVRCGDLERAVQITRRDNAMAAVLGQACHHPCERTCVRTHFDQPLAIRELKRFIMAHELADAQEQASAPNPGAVPVAVIGAGPCGFAVGDELARAGYPVTIFEASEQAGGMVSATIPIYRTSQAVIDQDRMRLERLGVRFVYGTRAGRDLSLDDLRARGFAKLVVAAGAQRGLRLGLPGEEAAGVHAGLAMLRACRRGQPPRLGRRVAVIGGGDVAMDCARTARRLTGGQVSVIYRRSERQMPAQREEIEALVDEDIELIELAAPQALRIEGGKLVGLQCARMRLGEADDSGRCRPLPIEGQVFELQLDDLLVAIGQRPDLDWLGAEIARTPKGYLQVDRESMESTAAGIYAGGDAAGGGPASIVDALGDGRRIAAAIRRAVEGFTPEPEPAAEVDVHALLARRARRRYRVPVPERASNLRQGFELVVGDLEPAAARAEAERCLDCQLMCSLCVSVCPNLAFMTYRADPCTLTLPHLQLRGGKIEPAGDEPFTVTQRLQVAVLTDWCNECGNCTTFCPTAGEPYREKPRLYLHRADFEAERDNAFRLERGADGWRISARIAGATCTLEGRETLRYRTPWLSATLRVTPAVTGGPPRGAAVSAAALELLAVDREGELGECASLSLRPAAELWVLRRALTTSLAHLPW